MNVPDIQGNGNLLRTVRAIIPATRWMNNDVNSSLADRSVILVVSSVPKPRTLNPKA